MYRVLLIAALVLSMAALAQTPATLDSGFQVKYASNLGVADAVFNISNSGAYGANICVNVYTFSPDEQLVSCCSCVVTPNALVSLSAKNDLISNTLTPAVPTSIVVKLISTANATTCNASLTGQVVVPGLLAWGTSAHAGPMLGGYSLTETAFTPATLNAAEALRIQTLCGFIQTNGSGYGICKSCRLGGLGAVKK